MPGGSFTDSVLAEVAPHVPLLACCRAALVEAMRTVGGGELVTTRLVAARSALAALHQSAVEAHVVRAGVPRRHRFRVLGAPPPGVSTQQSCCHRSRLRGAFLASGRVSRPEAPPHLEFGCNDRPAALQLIGWLAALDVSAQLSAHGGGFRVAVRSTAAVGDVLSLIGAQGGRLHFEEGRVLREVRASVNRQLNAETANLRRTVLAGVQQLAAIAALEAAPGGLSSLPPALREAAELRRRHTSETLDALAERAGCSRSAMAGRLSRLLEMAARAGH